MTKSALALAYEKECHESLADARRRFAALENAAGPKTVAAVLEPWNEMWMVIDRTLSRAGLLREVHPDRDVRAAADACEQEAQKLITEITLARPLYDAMSAVDASREDAPTQRYLKHVLRDFRRAGVDKDETARRRVAALKEELVKIGQEFAKNIREDVRGIRLDSSRDLEGLPQDYIDSHKPGADGKITVTTDYPDYVPFMTYAMSDARRLELYKAFRQRGTPKNLDLLKRMLEKRFQLATTLGYAHWADYVTEDKMIKTAEAARAFLKKVDEVSATRAERDYQELLAVLRKIDPAAQEIGDWRKAFVEEAVKRGKYRFDSQEVRPYFAYDNVKQGVLGLTSRLFGVAIKRLETADVWHASVEAYEMSDASGVIGRFYLDMHPRDDKYKHAAAFPIQAGVAGKRLPEAALACNFPSGRGLMEHDHVETFFHEFGHLIHHLFGGRQRWVGVSGFNTEWDFVETPSQMLEEWAWDDQALATFAKDEKGKTIPEELVNKMRKARDFGKGLWARQQIFYASLSLAYHDQDPGALDTTALMKALQAKYTPFKYVEDTYFHASFGHLDGYSAIYYTYLWSLVIAKDLFSVFEKEGMLNPAPAARYRKHILEPGGSKDAKDLVSDFLGRAYTFESFTRWLNGS